MASGGAGGGGDSVYGNPGSPVQNAQVNTGGGGAGGTYVSPGIIYGGSGGSGICLVRYEL
jgi:hypothetical protein